MNSDELAEHVAEAIESACERVMGTGKEQYEDAQGKQKFEKLSMVQLLRETLEELDDVMVYNVMLRIRMAKLLRAYENTPPYYYPAVTVGGGGGTGIVHYTWPPTTTWYTKN